MNRSRLLMIGGLALAVGLLVSFTVYNRLRNFAGAPAAMSAECRSWSRPTTFRSAPS